MSLCSGCTEVISTFNLPYLAIKHNNSETLQNLVDAGISVDEDIDHWTPLQYAAHKGRHECLQIIIDAHVNVNYVGKSGMPALNWSIEESEDHTECALALIKAGAKLNYKNEYGMTPLHRALEIGNNRIALALIEAGADVNATCNEYKTLMGFTFKHIIFFAIYFPDTTEEVIKALVAKGADINATNDEGDTPLIIAAKISAKREYGHWRISQLIDLKADPFIKNKYDKQAIDYHNSYETYDMLKSYMKSYETS